VKYQPSLNTLLDIILLQNTSIGVFVGPSVVVYGGTINNHKF